MTFGCFGDAEQMDLLLTINFYILYYIVKIAACHLKFYVNLPQIRRHPKIIEK